MFHVKHFPRGTICDTMTMEGGIAVATRWTQEQQQAIQARNHTILVSAAAGSGKTAVLVERIVTLLKEGFRLNRMLIVTFTRAASADMRG